MYLKTLYAETLSVSVGEQRIVMRSGQYNTTHFPDQPISILSEHPFTVLLVCSNGTKLLYGKSWDDIAYEGLVLRPSGGTGFDNGYAGIGGIYQEGKTIYGLYHAEDQVDKYSWITKARNQYAAMFSVGLAISQDGGQSFQKMGQVLSSKHPYKQGDGSGGLGDITMCADRKGEYLLAYYADFSRGQGKGTQICAARCPIAKRHEPGAWKKYYQGAFNEPGLGGSESYVLSGDHVGGDAWCPHVMFCKELDRYLLTFGYGFRTETDGFSYYKPKKSGIYVATSENGVNWSEPVCAFVHSTLLIPGYPGAIHPTLYISGKTKDGVTGTLFYAYTPNWTTTPHHLAGRPIKIKLNRKVELTEKKNSPTNSNETKAGPSNSMPPVGTPTEKMALSQSTKNAAISIAPKSALHLSCDNSTPNEYFVRKGGHHADGKSGMGLKFDGNSNAEVKAANLPTGNSPRSLAVWLRNERKEKAAGIIQVITHGKASEKDSPFGIIVSDNKWKFFNNGSGVSTQIEVDKNWHHHCITTDGKMLRYFFDGRNVASEPRVLESGGGSLKLGGLGNKSSNFIGTIDEVVFFDFALSDQQVQEVMASKIAK